MIRTASLTMVLCRESSVAFALSANRNQLRPFSTADAKLPRGIELRPAAGAVFRCEILSAVRAVRDFTALWQSASAEFASLGRLHRGHTRHHERSPCLTRCAPVSIAAGSADRVSAGSLRGYRYSEFLQCVGRERNPCLSVVPERSDVRMCG